MLLLARLQAIYGQYGLTGPFFGASGPPGEEEGEKDRKL
jgi:hypothetical protein